MVPALVFVLIAAGIRVSQYGIDHTILVFGDKTLVSGRPAAIRICLAADDGRFFLPEHLTVSLVSSKNRYALFDDAVSDRGTSLGVDFFVPKMPPGAYDLELDVRFDKKRRVVLTPVTVADRPPDEPLEVPEDVRADDASVILEKDGVDFELFSEDRGIPAGIQSALFIRAVDEEGHPASVALSATLLGQGNEILSGETDKLGLFAASAAPPALDARVRIEGARYPGHDTDKAEDNATPEISNSDAGVAPKPNAPAPVFSPKIVYLGISAAITEPISSFQTPVKVIIEQIANGGPVYADLYHEGRLVHASSGRLSGARAMIQVRPKMPGLYRLQVYTASVSPGSSVAVRHFYVTGEEETAVDGLRTLLRKLISSKPDDPWAAAVLASPLERGGFEIQKAAAFVLARLYRGHRHPDCLISSRKEDDATLGAFKAKFQRMIMAAVIILGFGVSCFIGLFAFSAHRRQQRITRMILADTEEDAAAPAAARTAAPAVIQGIILLLIVLGAFVSIAVLIDTMTWSGG